ncbi:IS5/IS1182 family transposase, partial [Streptomyces sp. NPDC055722]
ARFGTHPPTVLAGKVSGHQRVVICGHVGRADGELCGGKREHNRSHKQVRARGEHVFARMKTWKILRDYGLKGDGVHDAVLEIARLHNVVQAG